MADVMKYDPRHPKREALVKAGLMEGGPQPAAPAAAPEKKQQERTQAP